MLILKSYIHLSLFFQLHLLYLYFFYFKKPNIILIDKELYHACIVTGEHAPQMVQTNSRCLSRRMYIKLSSGEPAERLHLYGTLVVPLFILIKINFLKIIRE